MKMEGSSFNGSTNRKLRSSTLVSKQSEMSDEQNDLGTVKSFIRVIGRNISEPLQIPEEFMAKFKGNLPHRLIIECSITKKCWRVDVKEGKNGKVYFGEGWNDFIESHSLKTGDFLVFEHEEQSIFHVKIYGKNGCEKSTVGCTKSGSHKPEEKIELEGIEESESEENISGKRQQKTRRLSLYGHSVSKQDGVRKTYTKATKVSLSGNRVSFSTIMHKQKIHQFTRLTIPKQVVSAKKLSSVKEVVLQVSNGNSWSVSIHHRWDTNASYFHKGWKEFVEANKIVGGNILRFEFISDKLIQVHVTKSSQGEHQSGDDEVSGLLNMDYDNDEPFTCTPHEMEIEASITSEGNPSNYKSCSFSFTWSARTSGQYLNVPKAVVEVQNLKNKEKVMLRDPEGKCWPLEVKSWVRGRTCLTKGWRDFWTCHRIVAGDSLYFKFVSECLIQVTINRGKISLDQPAIEEALENREAIDPLAIEEALENREAIDNGETNYMPEEVDNGGLTSQEVEFA